MVPRDDWAGFQVTPDAVHSDRLAISHHSAAGILVGADREICLNASVGNNDGFTSIPISDLSMQGYLIDE